MPLESPAHYGRIFLEKTNKTYIQLLRYTFVGGISTILDTAVFMVSTVFLNAHYLVAQTFGFLAGISLNYFLSISFIFESKRSRLTEITLFLITGLIGLILSYILLWFFIDILSITTYENLLAKLLTIVIVLGWNFTSRKLFIF